MVARKSRHRLISLCSVFVIAALVATILVGPTTRADSIPAVPTTSAYSIPMCYSLTLTFYVYSSKGQVQFAGTTYSNGQSVTVCTSPGTSYAISAINIANGYYFHEWFTTTNGQFGDSRASPTVFIAPTSSGSLTGTVMLVLEGGVGFNVPNLFGGYLLSSPGKSAVQGSFRVPAFTYVTPRPGLDPNNEVAIGVGLGGVQGVGWWTVLVTNLPSSGAASMWVQDWVTNTQNGNSLISSQSVPTASPSTQITATISYAGGAVFSTMCGFSDGCRNYAVNVGLDLSTAQWFAADLKDCLIPGAAWYACHEVPKFTPFQFQTPDPGSQTYPSLVGALLYLRGPGASPQGGSTPIDIVPGRILSSTTFPQCHASSDCTLRLTNQQASSTSPAVAVDSSDNYHVVWVDSRDGNNEIYYKKVDQTWNVLVDDTRLTVNTGDSLWPAVAVSPSGIVTVVWSDNRGGKYDIYRKQYTTGWGADVKITTSGDLGFDAKQPDVAVRVEGGTDILYQVWRDVRRDPGEEKEQVWWKVNDGAENLVTTLSGARIDQAHNDRLLSPRVALGNEGPTAVHIVFSQGPAYPVESGISYMYYVRKNVVPTLFLELGTNADSPRPMNVEADQSGHVYAVWHLYGGTFDVAFRKSDDGGATWSTTKLFGGSNYQLDPDVVAGPNGKVFVFWADNTAGQYEIYYATSADYGVTWSVSRAVTNAPQTSGTPRAAASQTSGKIGVAWRDMRDGNDEIYFADGSL